jgi:hypothetical protein
MACFFQGLGSKLRRRPEKQDPHPQAPESSRAFGFSVPRPQGEARHSCLEAICKRCLQNSWCTQLADRLERAERGIWDQEAVLVQAYPIPAGLTDRGILSRVHAATVLHVATPLLCGLFLQAISHFASAYVTFFQANRMELVNIGGRAGQPRLNIRRRDRKRTQ